MGVPGPKELIKVAPSIALIDLTLAHVKAAGDVLGSDLDVVVVVDSGKEAVHEYVLSRLPGIAVTRVFFDRRFKEWPGSVHSAAPFCGERVLVLMPDSLLTLSREDPFRAEDGRNLAEITLSLLGEYAVAFGAARCPDFSRMSDLGALWVENGEVSAFEDKPKRRFDRFNSVWGCFAFRRGAESELFEFLDRSVSRRNPNLIAQSFHPAGAFPLHFYADLGTPERLDRNRKDLKRFLDLIP